MIESAYKVSGVKFSAADLPDASYIMVTIDPGITDTLVVAQAR